MYSKSGHLVYCVLYVLIIRNTYQYVLRIVQPCYKEFIKEKYRATKSKMASWKLNQYIHTKRKGISVIANSRTHLYHQDSDTVALWAQFMLIYREVYKVRSYI